MDQMSKTKEILPIGKDEASFKLHDDIAQMLFSYATYHKKPISKNRLQKMIAFSNLDMRAGLVAVNILARVQQYLDEIK